MNKLTNEDEKKRLKIKKIFRSYLNKIKKTCEFSDEKWKKFEEIMKKLSEQKPEMKDFFD